MPTRSSGGTAAPTPGVLGTQRWKRLLPIAFVTYCLAYLDRSNFSIAVAGGMKADLHITGGVSALIGAEFFLGYFVFQIPGAIYAERRSAVRWSSGASSRGGCWPRCRACSPRHGARSWCGSCVGVVEAAVLPAMVILLATGSPSERGRANTYLILATRSR